MGGRKRVDDPEVMLGVVFGGLSSQPDNLAGCSFRLLEIVR